MEKTGLYAYCDSCGNIQGIFQDEGEIIKYIAQQRKCQTEGCETFFSYRKGEFWNLTYDVIPSKEEFALKLLEEISPKTQQAIFGYRDKGPGSSDRYPKRRVGVSLRAKTDRATKAVGVDIFKRDADKREEFEYDLCFDNPDAILQLIQELFKGIRFLKHGKK